MQSFAEKKCQELREELGYWEVSTEWNTKLGAVVGTMSHVDYDGLQAMIADCSEKFVNAIISDPVYWPPIENHILEFEQMARCLDDEVFLTTGQFRNGLFA